MPAEVYEKSSKRTKENDSNFTSTTEGAILETTLIGFGDMPLEQG